MSGFHVSRRGFLTFSTLGASSLALSGCDLFDALGTRNNSVRNVIEKANDVTYHVQRMVVARDALAPEYTQADIREPQRPNGITAPDDPAYKALQAADFSNYKLEVTGLVDKPLSLTMEQIRNMPSRTQITRHDCVEGWSCISKWTGVQLSRILDQAVVKPQACYAVFHCMDTIDKSLSGDIKYYESIDMIDARHPQTILAYGLDDKALPVANGAPLRARVERQLGYKMAKYIKGIELTDSLVKFGKGHGGYWEDEGYDWYAGI